MISENDFFFFFFFFWILFEKNVKSDLEKYFEKGFVWNFENFEIT